MNSARKPYKIASVTIKRERSQIRTAGASASNDSSESSTCSSERIASGLGVLTFGRLAAEEGNTFNPERIGVAVAILNWTGSGVSNLKLGTAFRTGVAAAGTTRGVGFGVHDDSP